MSTDTLNRINALSQERLDLYEQASRQPLMPAQLSRLDRIGGELPNLWDQYRRELVAERKPDGVKVARGSKTHSLMDRLAA